MMEVLYGMLRTQPVIMILWSFICFLLGSAVTATLYWYRIQLAIKIANKKIEDLREKDAVAAAKGGRRSTDHEGANNRRRNNGK
jgi:ABC-type transport system involved in cytochrome bd biosynthesis fused ATPase/permease subunit